ncbi:protein Mpv17-like isoform X5 [Schistocerca gregaria]|uniref:protein Mpv17-like isoform X5 n=1 Tax=Schistocerca gregaria TaxID=7010 RepID=UPI00211E1FDA|nr:protein Mpv17-like isoform X5 [Schistocerca gregaria]
MERQLHKSITANPKAQNTKLEALPLTMDNAEANSFHPMTESIKGPVLRTWFGFLDSRFKGRSAIIVVKKVALDQLCFVPVFLGVLVSIIGFANGKSLDQVKEKLEADYPDIMMTNYKIWPLVQTLNFSVVPVHYQVPLVQVVAVGWNTYMSWKAHQPVQKKQEPAHVE